MTTLHPARSRGCREGRVGIPESRLQNRDFLETSRPVCALVSLGQGTWASLPLTGLAPLLFTMGKAPAAARAHSLRPPPRPPGVLLRKLPLSLHVEHEVPAVDVLYDQE